MAEQPAIQDLDILRPPPEYLRLGGKDIDISFIPSGVAMEIMGLQDKINDLSDTPEKVKNISQGGSEAQQTFDLSAELCAKVTSCQHPDMNKEWLLRNTSVGQLKVLISRVTQAVYKSLETAEDEELKKQSAADKSP